MVAAIRFSASSTRGAAIEPFEILRQRAHGCGGRLGVEQRRHGAHAHRVAAELLHLEPEPLEIRRVRDERLASVRRQVEQQRLEQALALEPSGRQPLHRPLEEHALVRHVLVDDGDALVVDRDDEGVAELAEGDHRADGRRDTGPGSGLRAPGSGACPAPGADGARSRDAAWRPGARRPGSRRVHRLG